jgi:hypothetical protein
MPVRLLRQIVSVLVVVAYTSAALLTVAPGANAAQHAMPAGMMMKTDAAGDTMPMPCSKHMKSNCFNELGCIFMVSLPAANPSAPTVISWSVISYPFSSEALRERSIKPALGPPISRA